MRNHEQNTIITWLKQVSRGAQILPPEDTHTALGLTYPPSMIFRLTPQNPLLILLLNNSQISLVKFRNERYQWHAHGDILNPLRTKHIICSIIRETLTWLNCCTRKALKTLHENLYFRHHFPYTVELHEHLRTLRTILGSGGLIPGTRAASITQTQLHQRLDYHLAQLMRIINIKQISSAMTQAPHACKQLISSTLQQLLDHPASFEIINKNIREILMMANRHEAQPPRKRRRTLVIPGKSAMSLVFGEGGETPKRRITEYAGGATHQP